MDDLISRQAAIDAIEFGITYAKAINKETGEVKELFQVSNDELRKAADRIKQLPSAQPKQRWIPCSERLPESKAAYYIVTLESRGRICVLPNDIDIARWDCDRRKGKDSWHWCKERKFIAWKPLPEPYQKEGEKQ